jgi:hypothetical protein
MKRRALIASSAHVVEYEQMPVNIFFTANEIRSQTPSLQLYLPREWGAHAR